MHLLRKPGFAEHYFISEFPKDMDSSPSLSNSWFGWFRGFSNLRQGRMNHSESVKKYCFFVFTSDLLSQSRWRSRFSSFRISQAVLKSSQSLTSGLDHKTWRVKAIWPQITDIFIFQRLQCPNIWLCLPSQSLHTCTTFCLETHLRQKLLRLWTPRLVQGVTCLLPPQSPG